MHEYACDSILMSIANVSELSDKVVVVESQRVHMKCICLPTENLAMFVCIPLCHSIE